MIRIAIGYVAVVMLCAVVILLNPMDFMGKEAREALLQTKPAASDQGMTQNQTVGTTTAADSVAATTAAILADLTAAASEEPTLIELPPVAANDVSVHDMSSAVLASLKSGASAPDTASLEGLVAQGLIDGKADEEINEIVNDAVAAGTISAPAGLTTAEGKVDTAVLLASIVAQAQGVEFGQGDLPDPTGAVDAGALATKVATEDVLYVVQAGDSLGSLALRFYGDAGLYTAIFKANRQVLETPASLADGMRLLIPARSGL